jgi:hypothetical protein
VKKKMKTPYDNNQTIENAPVKQVSPDLQINTIKSIPAYLKIANIVSQSFDIYFKINNKFSFKILSFLGGISVEWKTIINLNGQPEFFSFVAWICLIVHVNFILFYIFRVIQRFPRIQWNLIVSIV